MLVKMLDTTPIEEMDPLTERFSCRVVNDISDPDLRTNWRRLQTIAFCHPQIHYEWCAPWWSMRSGPRKLETLLVSNSDDIVVGVAPLCLESRGLLKVLRSFPIHFGDFFNFIIDPEADVDGVTTAILDYCNSFKSWDLVNIYNVNSKQRQSDFLSDFGYSMRPLTDIWQVDFGKNSFDEYLQSLSRNTRQQFRKKIRQLHREGDLQLKSVRSHREYVQYEPLLKEMFENRWADDHKLPPTDKYYECRSKALSSLFDQNIAILYLLELDQRVIAFRIGFLYGGVFYDWKVCHDSKYEKYSPGNMIIGLIIETLISTKFNSLNFMTGDYSYKRSWAPNGPHSTNNEYLLSSGSFIALVYMKYILQVRPILRESYYSILSLSWVRTLKRSISSIYSAVRPSKGQ